MFFTSQYFSIGKQALTAGTSPRPFVSLTENNRQSACLCPDQVGSPSEPCVLPGNENNGSRRDRMSDGEILVQNHVTMKNARKQLGEIASKDPVNINPGPIVANNPDALPLFENQVFFEKSISRQPESPETESFRSWLKTNTPQHKASPALVERIKRITRDENA